MYLNVNTLH